MAKNAFNKAAFEEKYTLYGDMLYRLGIIYFSPREDYFCQEAMEEAFLWLLTRKKGFKNAEEEKLGLLRHMVLICKSKSGRKPKKAPQTEEEISVDTSFSESMDMLEALYRLPNKYKPVLHLAFYESLDVKYISKILSMPKSIIKKLLTKGIEFMEMVMERKLDKDCYCSMMNKFKVPSNINDDIYSYITEGRPNVKTYLSPVQKGKAILAAIAIAALSMGAIRLYPVIKPVVKTKYAFMNGTVYSVTINNLYETNVPGILFAKSENGYQGYTINGNSLEKLETKHITKTIDYVGQKFPVDFYYCIKDGHMAVFDSCNYTDYGVANIELKDYTTEKVLLILYHYDTESLENRENGEGTIIYPLIMDINTLDTTDFISSCGIPDYDRIMDVNLNTDHPGAIIRTKNNDIYYLNIKSSSAIKLPGIEKGIISSAYFYDDETLICSITDYEASTSGPVIGFYEYSMKANTLRKCCDIDLLYTFSFYDGDKFALLKNPDYTLSIIDIRSGTTTRIPDIQLESGLSIIVHKSPDGRHIIMIPEIKTDKTAKIS